MCLSIATQQFNAEAWYLDSGVSEHMTSRKEIFKKFNPHAREVVTVANGN